MRHTFHMKVTRISQSLIAPLIFGSLFSCGSSGDGGAGLPPDAMMPEPGVPGLEPMTPAMPEGATPPAGNGDSPSNVSEEGTMPVALDPGTDEGDGTTPGGPDEQPMDPEPEMMEPGAMEPEPPEEVRCQISPIPDELRERYDLDPFYTKHTLARGIPVISSNAPVDLALERVCELVIDILSVREDVVQSLLEQRTRFAVVGVDELTNDIPEYRNLPDTINQRARGLGGVPAGLCAEESILCDRQRDRWRGEGICVHEYAHTIATAGLFRADPTFQRRLREAFDDAEAAGRFEDTYAMTNLQEYWAEGAQNWYNTNLESIPSNGVHNEIDKREELRTYDPALYGLLAELLPDVPQFRDCYSDVD